MAAFQYEAMDAAGKLRQGVLEADSPRAVRQWLREQGWMPVAVAAVAEADGTGRFGWRQGLSARDLALLTRQFATLLDAGMAMEPVLNALIEQADTARLRTVLATVRADVMAGQGLARAMARHPRVFPEIYRTLVAAGEQSGRLGEVMDRLADYTESRDALRQKVVQASVYPLVLSLVAVSVIMSLMIVVVPKVVHVFEKTHQTLPLLTRILIHASDLLRLTWPVLLIGLFGGVWLLRRRMRVDPAFRAAAHARFMRLPLLGPLAVGLDTARLAATLAILAGAGVPLLKALEAGVGVLGLAPMRTALEDVVRRVREGAALARALAQTRAFPPMLVHLVASGEQSGRLERMLERAAAQQSNDLQHRIATLASLLEPALILIMGGIVLLIVLAVMEPIFAMNTLLTR